MTFWFCIWSSLNSFWFEWSHEKTWSNSGACRLGSSIFTEKGNRHSKLIPRSGASTVTPNQHLLGLETNKHENIIMIISYNFILIIGPLDMLLDIICNVNSFQLVANHSTCQKQDYACHFDGWSPTGFHHVIFRNETESASTDQGNILGKQRTSWKNNLSSKAGAIQYKINTLQTKFRPKSVGAVSTQLKHTSADSFKAFLQHIRS